jgi:hypothetical protein
MDFESAHNAFRNQAMNAAKKRVPFEITFKLWCDIWTPHIHMRGKLQMQRIDKAAGYVEGNLRIAERPKRY